MELIIKRLEVGVFMSNCYLVGCAKTREGIVIDPGAEGSRIVQEINRQALKIKYIVNTHGHVDHVGANYEVKKATGAPVLIHEADFSMFEDPQIKFFSFLSKEKLSRPDQLIKGGDKLEVGELTFEVIETPGHSPGGICLKVGDVVFTGDTLFNGSIGRTDLPGGSFDELIKNIKEKLLVLPENTLVYPGHGPDSTIGEEKVLNPFLQY